jgi:hypothetical protein
MLGNIAVGAASASNSKTHVIITQVFFGELSKFLVKGGREHHVMMIRILIHIFFKSKSIPSKSHGDKC